jgi:hypothetical protein
MPQLILNSEDNKPFKSFVFNCDKDVLKSLSWEKLFNIISIKYNINKNKLYFKNYKGQKITNLYDKILNTENFRMVCVNTKKKTSDYWFSFGVRSCFHN